MYATRHGDAREGRAERGRRRADGGREEMGHKVAGEQEKRGGPVLTHKTADPCPLVRQVNKFEWLGGRSERHT
jgi:hypothetical protein